MSDSFIVRPGQHDGGDVQYFLTLYVWACLWTFVLCFAVFFFRGALASSQRHNSFFLVLFLVIPTAFIASCAAALVWPLTLLYGLGVILRNGSSRSLV